MWQTKKGNLKGDAKFSDGSIRRILRSRLYLGEYEFEGTIYDGIHDPIVKREIYEEVQQIIKQNSTNPKAYVRGSTPSILTNICYCGFCNSSLTTTSTKKSTGQKYFYYKCVKKNNESKTKEHAPKDLPVATLDNFVSLTMSLMLKEPMLLIALKKRVKQNLIQQSKNCKIKYSV